MPKLSKKSLPKIFHQKTPPADSAGGVFNYNNGLPSRSVAKAGGGGGIRTHGTFAGSIVFKTIRLNHSRTPPFYSSIQYCYNLDYMRTTQRKGDIAVAKAITRFTFIGYDVSLPLTESAAYDLIVDTGKNLKRVQVRYSSVRQVALRRIHSNSKGYVVKKTKNNAYDWLYIFKDTGEEYLIKKCLANRNSLVPTPKYLIN